METLKHKLIIKGQIEVITGLHIGGSASNMEIGALDQNNVIKTANGIPYIPGSSLKGKLRNMLAKATGSKEVGDDEEKAYQIDKIFGVGAKDSQECGEALLRIRDAYLNLDSVKDMEMDFKYSEVKYENSIKRISGEATPRPLERVPAGAVFEFEMIYDCFEENEKKDGESKENEESKHLRALAFAMKMLQLDSLGGSGTRGSGKIKFKNIKVLKADINTQDMVVSPELDSTYTQFDKFNNEVEDENSNC